MQAHASSNADVAENGCGAIWSLSANNNANKEKLGSIGGCEVIVEAVKSHPKNSDVASQFCWAVESLSSSSNPNLLSRLKKLDVPKYLQSIINNSDYSKSHSNAQSALSNLSK
jgi:hypothetical protein